MASSLLGQSPESDNCMNDADQSSMQALLNEEKKALMDTALSSADRYYQQGNLRPARDLLRLAIHLSPESPSLLATLGAVEYQLGEYPAALQSFARALKYAPENARVHTQMAATWLRLGKTHAFESQVNKALALDVHLVDALKLRAQFHLQHGQYLAAAQWYHRINAEIPNDLDTLLALAKCFFELRDYETTRATLERAREVAPNHEMVTSGLEVLNQHDRPVPSADHVEMSFSA